MSLLKSLEKLIGLGGQPAAPQSHPAAGNLQAISSAAPVLGNNTPAARAYQQNPMASHADPAQFGYPAENPRLQVNRYVNSGLPTAPNLGVNSMPVQGGGLRPLQKLQQGGAYNPGYTPLQVGGFSRRVQNPQFNPQVLDDGYYYDN